MFVHSIDGFIEEKEGDKYLDIASTDKNSEVLRKYSEVWSGIKDCTEKINDSKLEEYDKDYMKIKFNSDDDINKQLNFLSLTVIIRNIFEKDGKYYPQMFNPVEIIKEGAFGKTHLRDIYSSINGK